MLVEERKEENNQRRRQFSERDRDKPTVTKKCIVTTFQKAESTRM